MYFWIGLEAGFSVLGLVLVSLDSCLLTPVSLSPEWSLQSPVSRVQSAAIGRIKEFLVKAQAFSFPSSSSFLVVWLFGCLILLFFSSC